VIAALLGFFVLKPIINARLRIPAKSNAIEASYPQGETEIRARRAVGS
jgi:hypothetical protein